MVFSDWLLWFKQYSGINKASDLLTGTFEELYEEFPDNPKLAAEIEMKYH